MYKGESGFNAFLYCVYHLVTQVTFDLDSFFYDCSHVEMNVTGRRVRFMSGLVIVNTVLSLPWVPEAFHARFPVSVKSFRRSCLRPVAEEAPRRTREKTSGTQSLKSP